MRPCLKKWHLPGLLHELVQLVDALAHHGGHRVAAGDDALGLSGGGVGREEEEKGRKRRTHSRLALMLFTLNAYSCTWGSSKTLLAQSI